MAPVILELLASERIEIRVCVTAQHRDMLDQVLTLFGIKPDYDLDLMEPNQALDALTARVLVSVGQVLDREVPDVVLVHGDTTTTLAASLAAFYRKLPVGHVEAGLRSGSLFAPWPEEMNRRVATLATQYHFAPTPRAKMNLLAEGVPEANIYVTGNTVIDALLQTVRKVRDENPNLWRKRLDFLEADRRIVLVTGHRRENFGVGFQNICAALIEIADSFDVQIVYPVHPNPNVRGPVAERLGGHPQIVLINPLDYEPFVALMDRAFMIITDSGGVQEEAPSLGKPVLVMREKTERPEAVEAGTVILVGADRQKLVAEAARLLTDETHYRRMAEALNPYGDGLAAKRIRAVLEGKQ